MAPSVDIPRVALGESAAPSLGPVEDYARACRAVTRRLLLADLLSFTALASVLLLLSMLTDFPSGGSRKQTGEEQPSRLGRVSCFYRSVVAGSARSRYESRRSGRAPMAA